MTGSFTELTEIATACRFRDCAHQGEPGCAVTAALDSGILSADPLRAFEKQERELDHLGRSRHEARQAGRCFARHIRSRKKERW